MVDGAPELFKPSGTGRSPPFRGLMGPSSMQSALGALSSRPRRGPFGGCLGRFSRHSSLHSDAVATAGRPVPNSHGRGRAPAARCTPHQFGRARSGIRLLASVLTSPLAGLQWRSGSCDTETPALRPPRAWSVALSRCVRPFVPSTPTRGSLGFVRRFPRYYDRVRPLRAVHPPSGIPPSLLRP